MPKEKSDEVRDFVFMTAALIIPGARKVVTKHVTSWDLRLLLLMAGVEPNPGPSDSQYRNEVTRLKKALALASRRAERARRRRQDGRDAKTRAELAAQGVEPNPGPMCHDLIEQGKHPNGICKAKFCNMALRKECLALGDHLPTSCPGRAKTVQMPDGEVWACCYVFHQRLAETKDKDLLLSAYYLPKEKGPAMPEPKMVRPTATERGSESRTYPEQDAPSTSSGSITPGEHVVLTAPISRPACPAPSPTFTSEIDAKSPAPSPAPPTPECEAERLPIKGAWLSGPQFARAQFCRHLGILTLIVGLACVCGIRLALPALNARQNLPVLLNATASMMGVVGEESASWLLLAKRKVEVTAEHRINVLMDRLYERDRLAYWKLRKWQRQAANKLRGHETWTQYLTRKNTTRSQAVKVGLGLAMHTIKAFYETGRILWYIVTMPVWIWSWLWEQYHMICAITSAYDLWDALFDSYSDVDVSALILEVPSFKWAHFMSGAAKIGAVIDVLDMKLLWKIQLMLYVQLALYIALSPLLASVHYLDLQAAEDCRIRTNAHVNMCNRPVRAHHYEWFEWYRTRHLYVIDHWVTVALSEFGYSADVDMFLKNVHQKFLRMAELNVPDEDYARYKSDTICYLENYLRGRFQQAGVRQWDASQQVRC